MEQVTLCMNFDTREGDELLAVCIGNSLSYPQRVTYLDCRFRQLQVQELFSWASKNILPKDIVLIIQSYFGDGSLRRGDVFYFLSTKCDSLESFGFAHLEWRD